MLTLWWLLIIGILTGLVTRTIVGGKAYGAVADALLGITGAFAIDWMLQVVHHTTISWSSSTVFTIWGGGRIAAACAFLWEAPNGKAAARVALRPLTRNEPIAPMESPLGVFDAFHTRTSCGIT